jgi:hypothetical protein
MAAEAHPQRRDAISVIPEHAGLLQPGSGRRRAAGVREISGYRKSYVGGLV